jgi:hypothetical protein
VSRPGVDAQDDARVTKHLQALLTALQGAPGRTLTNHEVRQVAGVRGMARVHDLQQRGYRIDVRKQDRSTWLVRYLGVDGQPALF